MKKKTNKTVNAQQLLINILDNTIEFLSSFLPAEKKDIKEALIELQFKEKVDFQALEKNLEPLTLEFLHSIHHFDPLRPDIDDCPCLHCYGVYAPLVDHCPYCNRELSTHRKIILPKKLGLKPVAKTSKKKK